MSSGLNFRQMMYFGDLLIMANDMQLKHMGLEIVREIEKRRERELPKFNIDAV